MGKEKMLFNIVRQYNISEFKRCFKKGDINIREKGKGLIHVAAECGCEKIICELLDTEKSIINSFSDEGYTPLLYALRNGKLGVASFLVKQGANVNLGSINDNIRPIHVAASEDQQGIVPLLIKTEASIINSTDKYGRTALHRAAIKGFIDMVKFLIGNGADIYAEDAEGNKPIDVAGGEKRNLVVQFLEKKASIKDRGSTAPEGRKGLLDASVTGKDSFSASTTSSLKRKSSLVVPTKKRSSSAAFVKGKSSLDVSAERGDSSIYAEDAEGKKPIDVAGGEKRNPVVQFLEKKASIKERSSTAPEGRKGLLDASVTGKDSFSASTTSSLKRKSSLVVPTKKRSSSAAFVKGKSSLDVSAEREDSSAASIMLDILKQAYNDLKIWLPDTRDIIFLLRELINILQESQPTIQQQSLSSIQQQIQMNGLSLMGTPNSLQHLCLVLKEQITDQSDYPLRQEVLKLLESLEEKCNVFSALSGAQLGSNSLIDTASGNMSRSSQSSSFAHNGSVSDDVFVDELLFFGQQDESACAPDSGHGSRRVSGIGSARDISVMGNALRSIVEYKPCDLSSDEMKEEVTEFLQRLSKRSQSQSKSQLSEETDNKPEAYSSDSINDLANEKATKASLNPESSLASTSTGNTSVSKSRHKRSPADTVLNPTQLSSASGRTGQEQNSRSSQQGRKKWNKIIGPLHYANDPSTNEDKIINYTGKKWNEAIDPSTTVGSIQSLTHVDPRKKML